jgi:HK97 family phage portal protein
MDLRKTFARVKTLLGNSIGGASIWSWAIPGTWTKTALILQYKRVVYAVVTAIAQDAAKVEFEMMQQTSKGLTEVATHPFLELMKRPNEDNSQYQFLEMHFTFMKLMGEAFWYMPLGKNSKKPTELYLLRPDCVEVIVDDKDSKGLVSGYTYNTGKGALTKFDKKEVVHFKTPNPHNPYRGLGAVEAGQVYIQTEQHSAEFTRNSVYNSGRPSGILNLKGVINEETFKQLKKEFKQEYTGTKNVGKTMLLKGMDGIDYQKMGMELGEVALKDLKEMNRDDIMLMFRMNKTILGISNDVNLNNAREARIVFAQNIIMPELDRFIDTLNSQVIPLWGDKFVLEYEDPTLQSDKEKLDEWTQGYGKWLTRNDIRLERGLKPVKGGDVFFEPITSVPVTTPPDETKTLKKVKKKGIENASDRAQLFYKILFNNQIVWERKYKEELDQELEFQKKEILENHQKTGFIDWLFNVEASKQRIVGRFVPLGISLMKEAAKFAFDLANDPDTELQIGTAIKEYIHNRVELFAVSMNDDSIRAIEQTISQGVADGEGLGKLRDRISEVFAEATRVRAERIARTETLAASNAGAEAAYKQSPLVTAKEWSAEGDACEFCLSLDGKIVGLDTDFATLGQNIQGQDGNQLPVTYEDIGFPPAHPNCRCAILPVAEPLN